MTTPAVTTITTPPVVVPQPLPWDSWPTKSYPRGMAPEPHTMIGALRRTNLLDEIIIGRTDEGEIATLSISMSRHLHPQEAPATTVYHRPCWDYTTLSMQGSTWKSRLSPDCTSGGQIITTIRHAARINPATPRIGEVVSHLCDVWEDWHLNDLKAGCAHQPEGHPEWPADLHLKYMPECPDTGYRWGSRWLVRPLPQEVVDDIRDCVDTINSEWIRKAIKL